MQELSTEPATDELFLWPPATQRPSAGATPSKAEVAAAAADEPAGEKRWYCIQCDGDFATLAALWSHQATHSASMAAGAGAKASATKHKPPPQWSATATMAAIRAQHQAGDVARPEAAHRAANAALLPPDGYESSASDGSGGYESSASSSESAADEEAEANAAPEQAKTWRCAPCDCAFALETQLAAHAAEHVSCPKLGCAFAGVGHVLIAHWEAAHEVTTCRSCGKSDHDASTCLSSADHLIERALPWRCAPCNLRFRFRSQLESHQQQHERCPKPGCGFSAGKHAVAQHVAESHDANANANAHKQTPSDYVCNMCGVPGHWVHDCPKGYVCHLCGVPGHPKHACPKNAARKADAPGERASCPAWYVCKACGATGEHVIYDCPVRIRRSDLPRQLHQQRPQPDIVLRTTPSSFASRAPTTTTAAAAMPVASSPTRASRPTLAWRCEPCETNFALQSQLHAHIKQHMWCPEPGCGFSAAGRLVKRHAVAAHGKAAVVSVAKPVQSSAVAGVGASIDSAHPDSADYGDRAAHEVETGRRLDELVVYRGETYRVQARVLEGEQHLMLVKLSGV